jgi:hypothetical protein
MLLAPLCTGTISTCQKRVSKTSIFSCRENKVLPLITLRSWNFQKSSSITLKHKIDFSLTFPWLVVIYTCWLESVANINISI